MVTAKSAQDVTAFKLTRIGDDIMCDGHRVAVLIEGDAPWTVFDTFKYALEEGTIIDTTLEELRDTVADEAELGEILI